MHTPQLVSRADLLRTGAHHRDIHRALQAGTLERVRPGVYTDDLTELTAIDAHRRLVAATWSVLRPGAVVSHFSAAALHDLPLSPSQLGRVWVTRPGRSGKIDHQLHLCRLPLSPSEVVELDEIRVTSLARTVADCTRRLAFDPGVVLTDAALRAGVHPGDLAEIITRACGRQGNTRSRAAAAFADGRSESPGESMSRVLMWRHHLPPPELQVEIFDDEGLIGRTDFGWRELGVLGEFDGRVKYSRELAVHGDPREALWREKQREDRLRRAGWIVVRWVWDDFGRPVALVRRIARALDEGRARGTRHIR